MKPLAGIRVVDLTRLLPGPLATLLLSDLGAEVLKVEEPLGGDPLRHVPPLLDGTSALFHALNRGKRFLSMDLKTEAGRERLLRLLKESDCLVEGFRPKVLERLGLAPQELAALCPRLVVCRMSGFGLAGPYAGREGHDLGFMALSGALQGSATPWPLPVQVADVGGALLAVSSILAALLGRDKASPAERVLDCPLLDSALLFAFPGHARQAAGDDLSPGVGMLEGGIPTYRMYRDASGRLAAVAAFEPGPLGAIEAWANGLDVEALARAFQAVSVAQASLPPGVEPVLTYGEARRHPAVQARSRFWPMSLSDGREVELPVTPFAHDPTPQGPWARPVGADDAMFP